jgi:hypothetical protein
VAALKGGDPVRTFVAATLTLCGLLCALPCSAAGLAPGSYRCFVFLNNIPTYLGTLDLDGGGYAVEGRGIRGTYSTARGVVSFAGPPPLGFKAAAAVAGQPGRFRLYPDAASVGHPWRAALCAKSK